jgi:hypothetical protein
MIVSDLWTVFLDYRGGTYVRQVRAEGPAAALESSLVALEPGDVAGLTAAGLAAFGAGLLRAEITPIHGLTNVWCSSLLDDQEELLLVNLVITKQ